MLYLVFPLFDNIVQRLFINDVFNNQISLLEEMFQLFLGQLSRFPLSGLFPGWNSKSIFHGTRSNIVNETESIKKTSASKPQKRRLQMKKFGWFLIGIFTATLLLAVMAMAVLR